MKKLLLPLCLLLFLANAVLAEDAANVKVDVLAKTEVHDNPQLLAHVIEWQLQVTRADDGTREAA